MVHSGSSSPMKTTPSASPHLTVPATAPPLQAAPLVPPPGNTTDQDLTQTPAKFFTTEFTSDSDLTQPHTPTPADADPPVVTLAEAVATDSCPASSWSYSPALTPAQSPVNGRTSGRKRTPKACDCCSPNSAGHDGKTSGRGRGRGKGRGKGRGSNSDPWDTPRRTLCGQLTDMDFDLNQETLEETEDEDDKNIDIQSQTPVDPPVPVFMPDGLITNHAGPETGEPQKKGDILIERSGVTDAGGKNDGDGREESMESSRMLGRGSPIVRGRGGCVKVGATFTSKMEDGGLGGVINSKMYALPQNVFVQKHGPNKEAEMDHDPSSVKFSFGNGVTVDLSDTEPREEVKEDVVIICEMENKLLSVSQHLNLASVSGSPQDLDSDMQVDQSPDQTDSMSAPTTLSNGDLNSPTNGEHCSALMEVDPYHSATVVPEYQGPITISNMEHLWALRDHRLYCQPQTWEEEIEGESLRGEGATDVEVPDEEEILLQLIELIHDFLESFYMKYGSFIPLSETDVLEYLKKMGDFDLSIRGLDIKREMIRYRAGLASAPIAGFMLTYNKHNLSLEDLGTLEEQNWLNDQIINMYGELLMEATQHKVHFFNSFFHKQLVAKGYEGVKRWTKKVDLFSKWLLLIPIHLEIHWSLITVTMATKTISYYDSQGIVFRHTTDNILKYLLSEAREKKQTAFQKGWKTAIIKGIPQQKNDSDCGVFVLEYCRCLSLKQPLLFSQDDMPRIRKRIYKELCDCRIND
ncbi:sentrin-specific protease 5-like [Antennarius striatus]|uniref:sentrin-specific protease 5-like n=1 Tax=Antennarius striatus TaxID=241820 RepID=UPI0035AE9AA1